MIVTKNFLQVGETRYPMESARLLWMDYEKETVSVECGNGRGMIYELHLDSPHKVSDYALEILRKTSVQLKLPIPECESSTEEISWLCRTQFRSKMTFSFSCSDDRLKFQLIALPLLSNESFSVDVLFNSAIQLSLTDPSKASLKRRTTSLFDKLRSRLIPPLKGEGGSRKCFIAIDIPPDASWIRTKEELRALRNRLIQESPEGQMAPQKLLEAIESALLSEKLMLAQNNEITLLLQEAGIDENPRQGESELC